MHQNIPQKNRRAFLGITAATVLLQTTGLCYAQAVAKVMTPTELVEELQKADTIEKALALFKPPVSKAQIAKSDYLLLDVPPIAVAGSISAHMMSELPGTDLFMLFNNKPQAKQSPLLAARAVAAASTRAEIRATFLLAGSTELMMIVRAGGKFYSVTTNIKVAEK